MHREKGISLIELMVTVAIIGILATIAIPNFQNFVMKARQTEAKENLAGIYTAEKAFSAEAQTYTYCLYQAGFYPEGEIAITSPVFGTRAAVAKSMRIIIRATSTTKEFLGRAPTEMMRLTG